MLLLPKTPSPVRNAGVGVFFSLSFLLLFVVASLEFLWLSFGQSCSLVRGVAKNTALFLQDFLAIHKRNEYAFQGKQGNI